MQTNPILYMQDSLCSLEKTEKESLDHVEKTVSELRDSLQIGGRSTKPVSQYQNPRVQFLRISSLARTRRGIQGVTPPYDPAGPSLLREIHDSTAVDNPGTLRKPSPLRYLALSNPHTSVNARRRGMPHAVSMPHPGFQAIILCGPGIGLSTFTSVPNEFPKALVEVANRPMVWYVLDWCYRMGITDITLITPPTSQEVVAAALAQNPYLTSLPTPTPDLLAPADLEYTTPTAELLRLPEVQEAIKSDFVLLPCDLVCDVSGEVFLESYFTSLGGLGGVGTASNSDFDSSNLEINNFGGEKSGRRGGLSVWYNTANREESIKGEECDFMCTVKLGQENSSPLSRSTIENGQNLLRELVWAMPMSELLDQCEEDKGWRIRQSLLRKHGNIKCLTQYRDSHIYFFPYWVKKFASMNEEFESVSEDLVGTWAKSEWRKPGYRARHGARKIFGKTEDKSLGRLSNGTSVEDEIDLLSLSSTKVSQQHLLSSPSKKTGAQLASRVQADPDDNILSPDDGSEEGEEAGPVPVVPPMLSYILSSNPDTSLVRRVDSTPLLLSVSLLLAKLSSIEEGSAAKTSNSPFAHVSKVHSTVTIAPRVTISRSDSLIDANSTIATQCVIKSSVIGSSVSIGTGSRITNCVIMNGATIGEKCVLTGTVVGKKARIGNKCTLQTCEVQDGNAVADETEGKGEKYLIGGLEDDVDDEENDDATGSDQNNVEEDTTEED